VRNRLVWTVAAVVGGVLWYRGELRSTLDSAAGLVGDYVWLLAIALIGVALASPGAYGKVAAVILGAFIIWTVAAPGLSPTLRTPGGPWALSLSGSRSGDELALLNVLCTRKGVEGKVVNLGTREATLVIRVTFDEDRWRHGTVEKSVLRLAPRSRLAWAVRNSPRAVSLEGSCDATISAARFARAG